MSTTVRSFAKINIGLAIGPARKDGFHELRTVYQTVGIHDIIRVDVASGEGMEIRCVDVRVPTDATNTCYRVAERVLKALNRRARVVIEIEKRLPVQGGIGGGSSNAVATMFAMERALGAELTPQERQRIAAEVGSDLPLFLLGGLVLGRGRGEEVSDLPDLPPLPMVIVTPAVPVSTPQAFRDWDALCQAELTQGRPSDRMKMFSQELDSWLGGMASTGVPTCGGDRAETLLLDLVRAGIVNDFERVVFPKNPELRDVKCVLEREGAVYASLSGSGSTLYGLFSSVQVAEKAAETLKAQGMPAVATSTLPRKAYREQMLIG